MKKMIIAFCLCVFAFSASANNNANKTIRIKSKEKKEQYELKAKKSRVDACQICAYWPGGGACGSAPTCEEALICLKIAME